MALRAGYFGLKRFEKNKLSILAASMPADISPDNPLVGKNDVLASIGLLDDTVGWNSKNLFITKNGSGTADSGLTETINTDYSLTLNGTTTREYIFPADTVSRGTNLYLVKPGKKYVFNVGVTNSNIKLQVYYKETESSSWSRLVEDVTAGNDLIFTVPDSYYDLWIRLDIISGRTLTNVRLYPMIIDADLYKISPTYEPYHESVDDMLFYQAGDVVELNGLGFAGFVTNGSTELHVAVTLSKIIKAANIILAGQITVRGIAGYVLQSKQISELTVSVEKIAENVVMIIMKNTDSSAFNVTNNTPLFFSFELSTAKLTFTDNPGASANREISTEIEPEYKYQAKKVTKKKVIKEEEE